MNGTKNLRTALAALQNRLGPDGPALAAQEFHHLAQQQGETVADNMPPEESLQKSIWKREILHGDESAL